MFKTAIVGCGAISKTHCESLKTVKNTEIVAFCDIIKERADLRAGVYGGRTYSSLQEMLDSEQIDVIHICTPHYLHVPMALTALSKGINVIMEKPPAISHQQYNELCNAQKNNAKLAICFQNRYNEAVVEAKALIKSGNCGKLLGARAIVTWSRNEKYYTESGWRGQLAKEGGGVLINQSIHTLDLMTYLIGSPKMISAATSNYHLKDIIDVEDTVTAFLEYDDFNALFFASTAYCKDAPVLLEIVYENVTIRLEGNRFKANFKDGTEVFNDYTSKDTNGKACWGLSHTKLISDFYSSLSTGKDFPVTLESTKPSFDAMMAIYDSAKTNKPVIPGDPV